MKGNYRRPLDCCQCGGGGGGGEMKGNYRMRMTYEHRGAMMTRVFDDDEEEELKEAVLAVEMGEIAAVEERMDFAENLQHERANHATRTCT